MNPTKQRDNNYENYRILRLLPAAQSLKRTKNLAEIATISFALISGNFLTLMVDRHWRKEMKKQMKWWIRRTELVRVCKRSCAIIFFIHFIPTLRWCDSSALVLFAFQERLTFRIVPIGSWHWWKEVKIQIKWWIRRKELVRGSQMKLCNFLFYPFHSNTKYT